MPRRSIKATSEQPVQKEINDDSQTKVTSKKIQIREKIDDNELITVRNATQGTLIYIDSDNCEIVWDEFGEEKELTMRELFIMKKKNILFFKENWVEVNAIVLNALGVSSFYTNAISIDEYETLFNLEPEQLKERIENLPKSIKDSIGLRAIKLINDGVLDSMKKIKVLEEVLGYSLIED